jgi:predicted nucleotidyltransferase component of viral defense system
LMSMHWETVTPQMRQILSSIGSAAYSERFYLAGGTALALQLGHRRSADLDFFSETDEVLERTRQEIIAHLAITFQQVLENTDGNLLLATQNIRVGFFSYGYPLIKQVNVVKGVRLASLEDIGLMKMDAIISRGARKDFYDLFFIARVIPLDALFDLAKIKYPLMRDFGMIALEHLVRFDNAD